MKRKRTIPPSLAVTSDGGAEQRTKRRFPISQRVRYRVVRRRCRPSEWSVAHTINISSSGVLIDAPALSPLGSGIELAVDWPALMGGRFRMVLLLSGRIARSDAHGTAIRIDRNDLVPAAPAKSGEDLPRHSAEQTEQCPCPPKWKSEIESK